MTAPLKFPTHGSAASDDVSTKGDSSSKDFSLTVNGRLVTRLSNAADDLRDQAIHYLLNKGLITSMDQIADIRVCINGHNVDVWLNCSLPPKSDIKSPQ